MGELFDVRSKKKDRGNLEVCGKIKDGNTTRVGCVVFSVANGSAQALESSGDPNVQDALIKKFKNRIGVR